MENPRKYCSLLDNPPVVGGEYRSIDGYADGLYTCMITGEPCIAREFQNVSDESDILRYIHPVIDRDTLNTCIVRNISKTLASKLAEDIERRKIAGITRALRRRQRKLLGGS